MINKQEDDYLIEFVPKGFQVRYENMGVHAGETDRRYNGGTIINFQVPRTGDSASIALWTACVAAGAALLVGVAYASRRRKKSK